ncbi:hypothetical protein H310_08154 [Aphanomyces invadans]|uniref:Uncharacterized protein n=1 Tax=Aphanomyces invadans TaxID=157072 RepID=A0A024U0S1_9STRA|nr:hypothetical protein H310_08154 [Aphanomyces invadans]ETV99476.1 hypothetical protein H310_08154 [Aphanomyces invadans]|eukprot:XP_008872032.1 hypothetical protein H310_08154 [Aphanomyces invadans]
MVHLRWMFVLDFDINDKKVFKSTLRSVQRFLKAQGYKRGRRNGSSTNHLSNGNALARDAYDRPHIVNTDESFIHHHYKAHHQSLYDPSDENDIPSKEKHKGRCYCFVAAVLDSPTTPSKVMALDIFTGGSKRASSGPKTGKVPKDYHGMFDHAYYVKWFECLLDELGVLVEACAAYGIEATEDDYKSQLWDKLVVYIKANIHPVIVDMAKRRGHAVIYTPLHHSVLQPIELVWAIKKGELAVNTLT